MTEAMKMQGLPFYYVNARDVLIVSEDNANVNIHWEESSDRLNKFIDNIASTDPLFPSSNSFYPYNLLITGYIASTPSGVATTLKRDGSDFSASIFGKLLKSSTITIWTDVSGVYSADPRKVPEAQIIQELSFSEAVELAYFGAKVIHPKT
jgi:aspartokinase/homoserine dehydrogenase 1